VSNGMQPGGMENENVTAETKGELGFMLRPFPDVHVLQLIWLRVTSSAGRPADTQMWGYTDLNRRVFLLHISEQSIHRYLYECKYCTSVCVYVRV
jgi:hypothetical protein